MKRKWNRALEGSALSVTPFWSESRHATPLTPSTKNLGKGQGPLCFPDNGSRDSVLESQQVLALPLALSGDNWQLTSLLLARVTPY